MTISKINGVTKATLSKINGVTKASVSKVNGESIGTANGTLLTQTLNTNADGQNGQTHVERVAAAAMTLPSGAITQVRVRFEAGSTEQLTITNAYVGHRAGAGDAYDFSTTPVQLLFSGAANVTIPAGTTQWSDWASFAYNKTSDMLVAYYMGGGTGADMDRYVSGLSANYDHFNKAANDAATVDKTGYGTSSGVSTIKGIESDGF